VGRTLGVCLLEVRLYETVISMEEKPMPGYRTKKIYKRWLSIMLILLCCASPHAPALGIPGRPVIANADDGKDDDDDDQRRFRNFSSCSGGQSFEATMFAVTDINTLLNFNPGTPGVINSTRFITGLSQGESVVGIDFRSANGQLYALTTANRLYTINPSNGAATPVGAAPITTALNGQSFGLDFNPTVDRIRVVSNGGQDLRLNPNNAAVAGVDGM